MTEKIIREVLRINDIPRFPTEISTDQTEEIVEKMGYEGVFHSTIKKLFPPYWRFLAHSFIICISGRRADTDEISLLNTDAISALATGLDFNFSRYLLNEMMRNVEGKRKDEILIYETDHEKLFQSFSQ